MAEIDFLTWNLHRCRGQDGIVDPLRTAEVVIGLASETRADIMVLTEADGEHPPYEGLLDLDRIQSDASLRYAHADPTLRWGTASHGFLGTIVFHAERFELLDGAVLDLPGHYPRAATILTFRDNAAVFRVIATHLSLSQALRAVQMRTIGQFLGRHQAMPTVLIGDLNEWRPWSGLAFSRRLVGREFRGKAPASFPSMRPFLPLDRVMASAPAHVTTTAVISSDRVRRTSDHLPVHATVRLG